MNNLTSDQTLHVSVPSKTFLLGEYAALANQPCVLIATDPRFSLSVVTLDNSKATCEYQCFSTAGAVSTLCNEMNQQLTGYRFTFSDPYEAQGGFGASSAQYLLLYWAYAYLTDSPVRINMCVKTYRQHASIDNIPPSGADIMTQFNGGITVCWPQQNRLEKSKPWPFEHITAVLLKTRHKVATHQHLKTLTDFPAEQLGQISKAGIKAIKAVDQAAFIDAIKVFSAALYQAQLTCQTTQDLLEKLNDNPTVLATKGCGALGADVIIAIVETHQLNQFLDTIKSLPLDYVSDSQQLAAGIVSIKDIP